MKRVCILLFALSLGLSTLCQPAFALTIAPGNSLWVQLAGSNAPFAFNGMRLEWSAKWDGNAPLNPDLDFILYGPPSYTGGFTEATPQTPSVVDLSIFGGQQVVFEFKNNDPGADITLPGGVDFKYRFFDNALPDWNNRNEIQVTAGEVLSSAPLIGKPLFIHYLADVNFSNIYGETFQRSDFQAAPIPEPGTLLLLSSGIAALAASRRKFKKK